MGNALTREDIDDLAEVIMQDEAIHLALFEYCSYIESAMYLCWLYLQKIHDGLSKDGFRFQNLEVSTVVP